MSGLRDCLIHSARVVCPGAELDTGGEGGVGWLLIRDGRIADRGPGAPPAVDAPQCDAGGLTLTPALIDIGARADRSGATGDDLDILARAALAGGVGALALSPDSAPSPSDPEAVALLTTAPTGARIASIGRLTIGDGPQGRIAELGLMREAGILAAGLGRTPVADAGLLHAGMRYAAAYGLAVLSPAKDASLGARAVAHAGAIAARLGLSGAPAVAEAIAIARDAALARDAGAIYAAEGVSTRAGVEAVRAAKAQAASGRVFALASAFNVTFNDLDVADFNPAFRLDPPPRAEDDRQAVIEALADGTIDVLCSGHDAAPLELKQRAFPDAVPGAAGLETLLAAALRLVQDGRLSLARGLQTVTTAPARLLGLPAGTGTLASGAPADLALIDMDAPWACRAAAFASAGRVTPFEGRLLTGRVRMVWRDGFRAYDGADATGEGGGGQ